MFPFDVDDSLLKVENQSKKEPADYEIDFETGKLTGRIIKGIEAVKQWIKLALMTDRYYFPQYSWTFGSDLNTLIGKNYDEEYTKTEVKRMIKEAISVDEAVLGYENLEVIKDGDFLRLSFVVNTIYGRSEIYV